MHTIIKCSVFFVTLIAGCAFGETPAHGKISFSCGVISADTPIYKKVESIYRQAFSQLGYEFEMVVAPNPKRSLAEARNGGTDGDCARIGDLNELSTDSRLLRVDVKILETKLGVWSINPSLQINSAQAIVAGNLTIGYTRGSLIAERFISTHKLTHAQAINMPEGAIKMLLAKRYDLLINSSDIITAELKRLHLEGKIFNVGTLERYDVYPYLNEKHKALLPQLQNELKKLIPPQGIDLTRLTSEAKTKSEPMQKPPVKPI